MCYFTVNGGWNCWSDWSECSTSCGGGRRQRHRSCTNPVPENGNDCFGDPVEIGSCNEQECATTPPIPIAVSTIRPTTNFEIIDGHRFSNEGWRKWASWTTCNSRGRKHRSRKCGVSSPGSDECTGCVKQVLRCDGKYTICFCFSKIDTKKKHVEVQ